jgi:hypothetical protein
MATSGAARLRRSEGLSTQPQPAWTANHSPACLLVDVAQPAKRKGKPHDRPPDQGFQFTATLNNLPPALFEVAPAQIHMIHGVSADLKSKVGPGAEIIAVKVLIGERILFPIVLKRSLRADETRTDERGRRKVNGPQQWSPMKVYVTVAIVEVKHNRRRRKDRLLPQGRHERRR